MRSNIILLVALSGCSPGTTWLRLEVPEGMRSAITTLELNGQLALVSGIDLDDPPRGYPRDEVAERAVVTAGFYALPLSALHLEPGPIQIDPGAPTYAPPRFDGIGRLSATLGDPGPWEILTVAPEPLAGVRLPAPRDAQCLASGGCFVAGAPAGCAMPCPDPSAIAAPGSPAPAEPMRWSPCPPGWSEQDGIDGAPLGCAPWPLGAVPTCAPGAVPLPGGCAPLGGDCPTGDYAASASRAVIYVRPGSIGGDGSMAAPFGAIAEALSNPSPGAVVALSKGRHPIPVGFTIGSAVRLLGACASETILGPGSLTITSPGVVIENVRLEAATAIEAAGSLELAHATAAGDVGPLFNVRGRLTVHDADLSGVPPLIAQLPGSFAAIDRAFVHHTANETPVLRVQTATLSVQDTTLVDLRSWGVEVVAGGALLARRVAIVGARERALSITGQGSIARLEDAWIDDTRAGSAARPSDPGRAVLCDAGGRAVFTRARIARSRGQAITVLEGSSLALTDVSVEDTQSSTTVDPNLVIAALNAETQGLPGRLDLSRVFLRAGASLALYGRDAEIYGRDLTVVGVETARDRELNDSEGIVVHTGNVDLSRVQIRRAGYVGLLIAEASALVTDLSIREIRATARPGPATNIGLGIFIFDSPRTVLTRVSVVDSQELGLLVDSSSVAASDLTIRDLSAVDLLADGALVVRGNSQLELQRASISGTVYAGMVVDGISGTASVYATDIEIQRTESACRGGCPSAGVKALCGGALELKRFRISESEVNAALLGPGGSLRLSDGRIERQQVGLAIDHDEPPKISQILDRVTVTESRLQAVDSSGHSIGRCP